MIPKEIDNIMEEDLQFLKDNSVLEGKTIEYKQQLPSNSVSDKKQFLADISSFANASTGDLIFGVVEERGIPQSIEGLDIADIDEEKLRLENMIRDGLEPRITGTSIKPIPLSNSRTVLVIRVPKSWNSPHRVIYDGHDKFYSRNSSGKYPIDVAELRIAFNLSEALADRIRRFRPERISKIIANETPIPLNDTAKIVLHVLPVISFSPAQRYDLTDLTSKGLHLTPMYCSGWDSRYNFDGMLTFAGVRERKSHSYVQLFGNGIIEAVEGLLLSPRGQRLIIPSIRYEQELISSLTDYLAVLKTLEVEPPIFIFLTLLGVKGYSMGMDKWKYDIDETHTIDRDILQLPEVIIESYNVIPEKVLKPCFDSIWNACGFPRALYYNDEEKWVGS